MPRDHTDHRDPRHRPPGAVSALGGCAPAGPGGGLGIGEASSAQDVPASVRGPATMLLVVYLVGLGLCVAANTASGTSRVVGTLKDRLFAPWMVPLWLDLGHDTRLTYGLPEDADHHFEIRPAVSRPARPARPGRGPATAVLRFPATGDHSERGARWRRLAVATVRAEEDAEQAGVLPAAIGAGLFRAAGDDDLEVRIVRRVAPDYESARSPRRDETALKVRVRRLAGELQLIPLPPAEEVAPLVDPAPPTGGGK